MWWQNLTDRNRRRIIVASVLGFLLIGCCVALHNLDAPWEGTAAKVKKSFDAGNRVRLPTEYYAQVYIWTALAANAIILTVLLLSSPFWSRWLPQREKVPASIAVMPSRRGWILLGIGLLVGLSVRLPMMERHLLFDEQDNMRRSFHGYVDITGNGEKWVGASWLHTFHENRIGNNPPLFGVLARACVDTWRGITGGAEDTFNLWALRFPSLLAGLLTMFVMWRFLNQAGMPVAAPIAVFFFAIHPLAVDYSTQARGYGVMMLAATLMIAFGWHATRTNHWKMWVGYGLSELAMLWAYPGSIYLALTVNIALGIYFILRWVKQNNRSSLTRFILTNIFSAMLFLPVMLPAGVQAKAFLDSKFAKVDLRSEWVFTSWNAHVVGNNLPDPAWWNATEDGKRDLPGYITGAFIREHSMVAVFSLLIMPICLALGLLRLRKGDRIGYLIAVAGFASPVLGFLHHKYITGLWLYHWYFIFVLPVVCLTVAIGLGSQEKRRIAMAVAFLILFAIAVETPRPAIPGSVHKAQPDVTEISRPGYLFKITKEGRMTREVAVETDPQP